MLLYLQVFLSNANLTLAKEAINLILWCKNMPHGLEFIIQGLAEHAFGRNHGKYLLGLIF
jgi:hypothetical protein